MVLGILCYICLQVAASRCGRHSLCGTLPAAAMPCASGHAAGAFEVAPATGPEEEETVSGYSHRPLHRKLLPQPGVRVRVRVPRLASILCHAAQATCLGLSSRTLLLGRAHSYACPCAGTVPGAYQQHDETHPGFPRWAT